MLDKIVQKIANSFARSKGYGKATEVKFGDIKIPKIVEAHSWYFETKGGTRIYHPSAYSKVGWSNMNYVPAHCIVMLPNSLK